MTQNPTTIRPANPGDIERLRLVEKAARQRYRKLESFEHFAEAPPIEAKRFDAGETLIADQRGKAIGFILLQSVDSSLYVANISVLPRASGQGVGRRLLQAAESRAAEFAAPAVTLATFKTPPWNGPWFRHLGYRPMPSRRIGLDLRAILERQAGFVDPRMRETLWKRIVRPGLAGGL